MRRGGAALLTGVALVGAGCGDDGELTVSAASSLTEAFGAYGEATPATERFSFGGSDELAAQIRQGAPVDVYAAASIELPDALAEEELVDEPTVFATNSLVLAVADDSPIDSIEDLTEPGVDLVIGAEDVPFGTYTRTMLERLPAAQRAAILANVRSEESDVKAAISKLAQGAADATFAYASDLVAAGDRLEVIELPAELAPDVAYGVAVVSDSENRGAAQQFVDALLAGEGAQALEDAGFGPAP